jgi:ABC-type phosphate/phosphonate transport system permease subunit
MENKVSIWKNAVNYGILAGILSVAFSLIQWLSGLMEVQWLGAISFLILGLVIFLGAKNWRDKFNGGWMTYGEAFKTGFFIILISSVIGVLYQYVFLNFIDPEFIVGKLADAEEAILKTNPNISDADLDRAMEMSAMFTSNTVVTIITLLISIFFGTILSAIIAIFAKKEDPAQAV